VVIIAMRCASAMVFSKKKHLWLDSMSARIHPIFTTPTDLCNVTLSMSAVGPIVSAFLVAH
jgi:hypothetical protein